MLGFISIYSVTQHSLSVWATRMLGCSIQDFMMEGILTMYEQNIYIYVNLLTLLKTSWKKVAYILQKLTNVLQHLTCRLTCKTDKTKNNHADCMVENKQAGPHIINFVATDSSAAQKRSLLIGEAKEFIRPIRK